MGTLAGRTFNITGTLKRSRAFYIRMIEHHGGTFKPNVSGKVNFVVAGDDAYQRMTGKLRKACNLDLFIIIREDELVAMAKKQ